jgi:hypothetical protein
VNLITLDQDQLEYHVKEALRQALNGLIAIENHSRKSGSGEVKIDIKDQTFQFQFNIAAKAGVNAIERVTTTTPGTQKSVAEEPQVTETTVTAARKNTSTSTDSGRQESGTANETQSTSENQTQNYGRLAQTDITYEN